MGEGVVGIKPTNEIELAFDKKMESITAEQQSIPNVPEVTNIARRDKLSETKLVYIPDRSSFVGDTLQIGDLVFGMSSKLAPPQVIHIEQQMINFKWSTLRSDGVSKIPSGGGSDRISISLYFVGLEQINSGLLRLLATFKAVPFVYIENSFLRANLSPHDSSNMAVSLISLSIRTEPGMTDVLAADLELDFFNYKPYASQFMFRQSYESESQAPLNLLSSFDSMGCQAVIEGVSLPSEQQSTIQNPILKKDPGVGYTAPVLMPQQSVPLMQIVKMNEGPRLQELSNRIDFDYRIYKIIKPPFQQAPDFGKENSALIRNIDTQAVVATGPDVHLKLHPEAATALENAARQFADYTFQQSRRRRKLISTSCYRSREEQLKELARHPAEAALFSWHEAGLAIDLSQVGWTRAEWDTLVQCMEQNGFVNLGKKMGYKPVWRSTDPKALSVSGVHDTRNVEGLRPDHEVWHFDYVKLQQAILKRFGSGSTKHAQIRSAILTYSGSIRYTSGDVIFAKQLTSETGVATTVEELRKRDEKLTNQLVSMLSADLVQGWSVDFFATNSGRIVLYKVDTFTIDERDTELIPQGIVISKRNLIAEIPLQGYDHATQQYLGAGDTEAVVSFIAVGIDKLQKLQHIIEMTQNNARIVREIRDGAILGVHNCLFQFAGLDEVLVDGISVQTLEGQPDTYSVMLQLTQAKRKRPRLLQQEKFFSTNAWKITAEEVYSKFFNLTAENVKNIRWVLAQINAGPVGEMFLDHTTGEIPKEYTIYRSKPYPGIMARKQKLFMCELLSREVQRYVYHENEVKYAPTDTKNFYDSYLPDILDTPIAELLYEYASILAEVLNRPLSTAGLQALGMGTFVDIFTNPYIIDQAADIAGFGPMTPAEENKIIKKLSDRLGVAWGKIRNNGLNLVPPFSFLANTLNRLTTEQDRGLPCYPDMTILPHPITNDPIDTPVDFWFWNESVDGAMFAQAIQKDTTLVEAKTIMSNSYSSLVERTKPEEFTRAYVSPNKGAIEELNSGSSASQKGQLAAAVIDETGMKLTPKPLDPKTAQQVIRSYKDDQNSRALMFPSGQIEFPDKELKFGWFEDGELKEEKAVKDSENPVSNGESERLQNILESCFQNLEGNLPRFANAFPTFKIYFMEEDELEEGRLGLRNFDDFYSYSAIKDIRFTDSHEMPASLCVISIVNISGELDTLQFASEDPNASNRIVERFDPRTMDTNLENPFSKLILMEGSKLQLRLGYSNNPDELEIVFNGQVVEVGTSPISNDIIQLVCQSYGVELVASPLSQGKFDDTQSLLSSLICSSELEHFGRWTPNLTFDPAEARASWMEDHRAGVLYTSKLWNQFRRTLLTASIAQNKPQDDNIFAPALESYTTHGDGFLDKADVLFGTGKALSVIGAIENDRQYYPFEVTPWDIFKEMELRHPGFVTAPRVYGNRYTMYFGPPAHGYWSRPLTKFERSGFGLIDQIKKSNATLNFWLNGLGENGVFQLMQAAQSKGVKWNQELFQETPLQTQKAFYELLKWLLIGRAERYKPFRNYFLLSSSQNIIANNMYASAHGTFNAVDLVYADDRVNAGLQLKGQKSRMTDEAIQEAVQKNLEHFEMKADDNIRSRETRVMSAMYTSCQGDYFARKYAVALLMKSLRNVYKGEIAILGNPRIKPYDICMIYDTYRDMYGPVEVGQVTHILSQETGFITQIKPDLIVTHDALTTQCTLDAMWRISSTVWNSTAELLGGLGVAGAGIATGIAATGVGVVGAALLGGVSLAIAFAGGYKLAQFAQSRQPIFYTPVCQGGKPLIAGIDGYKRDNLLVNLQGKWVRWKDELAEGMADWWERNPISTSMKEIGVAILE